MKSKTENNQSRKETTVLEKEITKQGEENLKKILTIINTLRATSYCTHESA